MDCRLLIDSVKVAILERGKKTECRRQETVARAIPCGRDRRQSTGDSDIYDPFGFAQSLP
jgi:hypothetical protein